jgi:hypothetical protein
VHAVVLCHFGVMHKGLDSLERLKNLTSMRLHHRLESGGCNKQGEPVFVSVHRAAACCSLLPDVFILVCARHITRTCEAVACLGC